MVTWLEAFKGIEKKESPEAHSLWQDFHIPESVSLPAWLNERYMKLGESGQDKELHMKIELALDDLEARTRKVGQTVSHNLETVFNG